MLDPLELVRHAKNRHYAYKPLSQTQGVLGQDYTPSILQGKDITKNPAGAAALAAQGVHGANTPQITPNSPLDPVQPTANGQQLPGFAGGGEVIGKVSKLIQDLLKRFGGEALPSEVAEGSHELGSELPSADVQLRRAGSQLNPDTGVDPYNSADRLAKQREAEEILGMIPTGDHQIPESMLLQPGFSTARQAFADGGPAYGNSDLAREIAATPPNPPIVPLRERVYPGEESDSAGGSDGSGGDGGVSPSSLRWIADAARKLGIDSFADDRARVATGIAKQFYGLDEHGHPKFGGEAWLSSQHGTPPRILDEMTAIPGDLARLANAVFGGKIPENANVTPDERRAMERQLPVPKWSDDAAARVEALDKAASQETGVGQAHSLPEHIEDAAGMLATPFPASKVAGEAPVIQRLFEYLTPVRPPTMGRYASDSTMLGGVSTALDKLMERLASKSKPEDTSVDPEFEQAAIDSTNQGYAGGGSTRRDLLKKLTGLAAAATAAPVIKTLVKDTPDVVKSEASALEHTAPATTAPRVVMKDENPKSILSKVAYPQEFQDTHRVMHRTLKMMNPNDPDDIEYHAYKALVHDIPNEASKRGTTPEHLFAEYMNDPMSPEGAIRSLITKHDPDGSRGVEDIFADDLETTHNPPE